MLIILYIFLVTWWPLAVECSWLFCTLYLCCCHGMYIVMTSPLLSNVTRWMKINTNTNRNALDGTRALSD